MKFKVYEIFPRLGCYAGISFVAAHSVEEANSYIKAFKEEDVHNVNDSNGYEFVEEHNCLCHIYSEEPGIVYQGIYYRG